MENRKSVKSKPRSCANSAQWEMSLLPQRCEVVMLEARSPVSLADWLKRRRTASEADRHEPGRSPLGNSGAHYYICHDAGCPSSAPAAREVRPASCSQHTPLLEDFCSFLATWRRVQGPVTHMSRLSCCRQGCATRGRLLV